MCAACSLADTVGPPCRERCQARLAVNATHRAQARHVVVTLLSAYVYRDDDACHHTAYSARPQRWWPQLRDALLEHTVCQPYSLESDRIPSQKYRTRTADLPCTTIFVHNCKGHYDHYVQECKVHYN